MPKAGNSQKNKRNICRMPDGSELPIKFKAGVRYPRKNDPYYKIAHLICVICRENVHISEYRDRYQGCMHHHCMNYDGITRECRKCEVECKNEVVYAYLKKMIRSVRTDITNIRLAEHLGIPISLSIGEAMRVWNKQKGRCPITGDEMATAQCSLKSSYCLQGDNAQIQPIDPAKGIVDGNYILVKCSTIMMQNTSTHVNTYAWDQFKLAPRAAAASVQPYRLDRKGASMNSKQNGKLSASTHGKLSAVLTRGASARLTINREPILTSADDSDSEYESDESMDESESIDEDESMDEDDDCIIIDKPACALPRSLVQEGREQHARHPGCTTDGVQTKDTSQSPKPEIKPVPVQEGKVSESGLRDQRERVSESGLRDQRERVSEIKPTPIQKDKVSESKLRDQRERVSELRDQRERIGFCKGYAVDMGERFGSQPEIAKPLVSVLNPRPYLYPSQIICEFDERAEGTIEPHSLDEYTNLTGVIWGPKMGLILPNTIHPRIRFVFLPKTYKHHTNLSKFGPNTSVIVHKENAYLTPTNQPIFAWSDSSEPNSFTGLKSLGPPKLYIFRRDTYVQKFIRKSYPTEPDHVPEIEVVSMDDAHILAGQLAPQVIASINKAVEQGLFHKGLESRFELVFTGSDSKPRAVYEILCAAFPTAKLFMVPRRGNGCTHLLLINFIPTVNTESIRTRLPSLNFPFGFAVVEYERAMYRSLYNEQSAQRASRSNPVDDVYRVQRDKGSRGFIYDFPESQGLPGNTIDTLIAAYPETVFTYYVNRLFVTFNPK